MPSATAHGNLSASSPEETRRTVDSDCPLFNCFGVLSGGVIIDPIDESFVEFTSSVVYTPSTMAVDDDTEHSTHDNPARRTLQQANEHVFRTGETHLIRPECPLIVCTSELPLPPSGSDPCPKHFTCHTSSFSAAGSTGPTVTSPRHAVKIGMDNVNRWLSRLATRPGHQGQSPKCQAWRTVWTDAEELRLFMRSHRDVRGSGVSLYLPPRLPFPLCFRGQPISLVEDVESQSATGTQQYPPDLEANSAAAVPPDGVRCVAASFTCYTGVPRFAAATDTTPRFDAVEFARGTVVTRLRKRLRPYAETASLGRCRDSSDPDEEERFLVPLTGSTPRQAAFALFLMYFNHLGILCNGVRITGEAVASSCAEGLDWGTTTWDLCSKCLYDVRAEVERKRRITRQLREQPEHIFAGGTRWSTTARNRDAVAAAWTALLLSSREALLERIMELNRHIHNLHEEKQRRRHTEEQQSLCRRRVE
ncbi:hypothetical protein Q4I30_005021 [Leishmania utingensis]|uniref:Uncharacterized protein n=1 Tax=Leishmania utingensis TaxID=653362 RepID=A0AAW3A9U1_9TRYP